MKTKLLIAFTLFCGTLTAGNIYYLQSASNIWQGKPSDKVITSTSTSDVSQLVAGDEIWITGGDYELDNSGVDSVTVRGGFAGTENNPDERNGKQTTSFTNDINQTGWNFDGCTFKMSVTLTGDVFVRNSIVSNYNNQDVCPLHIEGSSPHGVLVENCWFYNNNTQRGALWCSHAIVRSCSFVNNHSRYSAGALYTQNDVVVENCFFYNNTEGVGNTSRDLYLGNSYKSVRDADGNLISSNYNEYGSNIQYVHSDGYIQMSATNCTLLQNDASPFIDKGEVSDSIKGKTIWGVNRYCDRIDVGCAEFQKPFSYFAGNTVKRPSFIKEEGWSVVDTSFVIKNGLGHFYAPGTELSFSFEQGDSFDVRNWHFNEGGGKQVDYTWDRTHGDTVRYETDTNVFDTLFITSTQVIDTFKIKAYAPLKEGVNSVTVELSEYNTSQDTLVYDGEEITLKIDYDSTDYHFKGWYCENEIISGKTEFTYKASTKSPFGIDVQRIQAYVLPDQMDVSYAIYPDDTYASVTTIPENLDNVFYGDTVSFKLIEAAGKSFKYWIDSTDVSVDTIYEKEFDALIQCHHVYKAYLEDIIYNVTVFSTINGKRYENPQRGLASVTGDGEFLYNDNTDLGVTIDKGYLFMGWRCPEITLDTLKENPYSLTGIKQDFEFEACLQVEIFKVDATVEPAGWPVTISQTNPDGQYHLHNNVTITVSDTLRMDCWQKYSNGTWKKYASACSQVSIPNISDNYQIRALYNPDILIADIRSEDEEKGSVQTTGAVTKGSEVTVSATANEGYEFDHWQTPWGAITEPAEFSFTLTQDTTLVAVFKEIQFNIFTTAEIVNHKDLKAEDYVKVDPVTTVNYDSTAIISAELAEGFDIVCWVVNRKDTVRRRVLKIDEVKEDMDVKLLVNHRVLKVSAYAEPESAGFNVYQTNESGLYYYGDSLTVVADSSVYLMGWHVFNYKDWVNDWVGYKSGELEDLTRLHIDSLTESLTLRAFYNLDMRFIDFEVSNPEYGSVEYKCKNFDYFCKGDTCDVRADVNREGRFDKWTSNDSLITHNKSFSFEIDTDSTFVAYIYSKDSLFVCAVSSDSEMGSATVKGTFTRGETVEFSADANHGYKFVSWTDEKGKVTEYPATFYYVLNDDITLTANFEPVQLTITTAVSIPNHTTIKDPDEYVKVTAPASVAYKERAVLSVECAEGFDFIGWVDKTNISDTLKVNTLIIQSVEKPYSFVAVANHQQFYVSIAKEPADWDVKMRQTNDRGVYYYGEDVTVETSSTEDMLRWEYNVDGEWVKYADPSLLIKVDSIKSDYDFRARYIVPVSVKETDDNSAVKAPEKVLINNNIYIIYDGKVIDLLGREAKIE